jgi:hypothetical protein
MEEYFKVAAIVEPALIDIGKYTRKVTRATINDIIEDHGFEGRNGYYKKFMELGMISNPYKSPDGSVDYDNLYAV